MKKITILLIALMVISVGFLSGCIEINQSENGKQDGDDTSDNDFWDDLDIEVIEVTSMGTEQTINYLSKPVELVVTGMNCVITVTKETNLKEVTITGMNSVVRVSRSHSFTSTITGMNAKIVYYD